MIGRVCYHTSAREHTHIIPPNNVIINYSMILGTVHIKHDSTMSIRISLFILSHETDITSIRRRNPNNIIIDCPDTELSCYWENWLAFIIFLPSKWLKGNGLVTASRDISLRTVIEESAVALHFWILMGPHLWWKTCLLHYLYWSPRYGA